MIGAIESCYAINHDHMDDDLSEQHILDCAYNHFIADESGNWGAFGCEGAWPNAYVDWLMGGEMNQEEAAYPYTSGKTGEVGSCRFVSMKLSILLFMLLGMASIVKTSVKLFLLHFNFF